MDRQYANFLKNAKVATNSDQDCLRKWKIGHKSQKSKEYGLTTIWEQIMAFSKFFRQSWSLKVGKMKKKMKIAHHKHFLFVITDPEDGKTTARLFSSFVQPRLKT